MISTTATPGRVVQPLISVVVACYNEEAALRPLYEALASTFGGRADLSCEFVLVDDSSRDRTPDILAELGASDRRITVVTLSRNFGQQAAFSAGLRQARGHVVILCDADLQDRPEAMLKMIEHWRNGADVVYGVRAQRKESNLMRAAYYGFYRLLRSLSDIEIPVDSGDFGLMDRKVVDAINALPESNRFLRGLRAWVGYVQVPLVYERAERIAGAPTNSPRKLIRLAFDGIFDFSTKPLTAIFVLGLTSSVLSLAGFIFFVLHRIIGFKIFGHSPADVPGVASIVLAIFFIGGVQLLATGIIGEYLGRVYSEVKRRPSFIVKSVTMSGEGSADKGSADNCD
jgi:glycosyltransferase involved in cell wall biosynthesis